MAIAATAMVAVACGPSSGQGVVGSSPSWRKPNVVQSAGPARPAVTVPAGSPHTLTPPTAGSAHYNAPQAPPVPHHPLADAIVGALGAAFRDSGQAGPRPDGRLYTAAQSLADIVPENAPLAYPLIEFALHHNGIVEPTPHLLIIWGPLDDTDTLLAQLQTRLPEIVADSQTRNKSGSLSRVGVGVSQRGPGYGAVILALQASNIVTEPIPRAVPEGGSFAVRGQIMGGYRNPIVFVTRPSGKVEEAFAGKRSGFSAEISCRGQKGRHQVEVAAEDQFGAAVLANFPVYCLEAAPAHITLNRAEQEPEGDFATPEQAEARMLQLVNRDRAAHGLPPLVLDAAVSGVARAHSEDMKQTGIVAHVSPNTGSATDRVQAAAIPTPLVMENIARAYGVAEAQTGLMNSPGHRANLLSEDATHIGIGIAFGELVANRREMFVTQVFTRVPSVPTVETARSALTGKLSRQRELTHYHPLDAVALEWASRLARGEDETQVRTQMSAQIDAYADRFRRVATEVFTITDIERLAGGQTSGQPWVSHYSMGMAKGSGDLGQTTIFAVLLLLEAR